MGVCLFLISKITVLFSCVSLSTVDKTLTRPAAEFAYLMWLSVNVVNGLLPASSQARCQVHRA